MWERAWRATGRRTVAGTRIPPPYFALVSKHWCNRRAAVPIRDHIGKMARKTRMRCWHNRVAVGKKTRYSRLDYLITIGVITSILSTEYDLLRAIEYI